jgi:hypothetical protein
MKPATFVKAGLRRALARRYGYAALRVLRRALVRALARHQAATFGPAPYAGSGVLDDVGAAYWRGLQRLRRRWPDLDLEDDRARP